MANEKDPAPVQGYVFGKLTPEEEAALMKRAAEDQQVFDDIWDAMPDRELLQRPEARRILLEALREARPKSQWAGAWQWLRRPSIALVMAGAAAVVVLALLSREPSIAPPAMYDPANAATRNRNFDALFSLPELARIQAELRIDDASTVYKRGDQVHASVALQEPAAVFVLRREQSGETRFVQPADAKVTADMLPGSTPVVFAADDTAIAAKSGQTVRLRMIAVPTGRDLRIEQPDLTTPDARFTVQEITYDVVP